MTIGNNYTFNLWVTVPSGEILTQIDENMFTKAKTNDNTYEDDKENHLANKRPIDIHSSNLCLLFNAFNRQQL